MVDLYTELKFEPNSSLEEIQEELRRLEQLWRRREINSPDRATEMLALINQAKKAFASSSSKADYDRDLENSRKKPVISNPNAERYKQYKKWYDKAISYLKDHQYDLARTSIDKAISYKNQDHDDAWFYNDAATIYRETKDFSLALSFINKALVIDETVPDFYITKGLIYSAQYEDEQNVTKKSAIVSIEQSVYLNAAKVSKVKKDKMNYALAMSLIAYAGFRPFNDSWYALNNPVPDWISQCVDQAIEYGDPWRLAGQIKSQIENVNQKQKESAKQKRQAEEKRLQQQRKRQSEIEEQERKKIERENASIFDLVEKIPNSTNLFSQDRINSFIESLDFANEAKSIAYQSYRVIRDALLEKIQKGDTSGSMRVPLPRKSVHRYKFRIGGRDISSIYCSYVPTHQNISELLERTFKYSSLSEVDIEKLHNILSQNGITTWREGNDYRDITGEDTRPNKWDGEWHIMLLSGLWWKKLLPNVHYYSFSLTKWGEIYMEELNRICEKDDIKVYLRIEDLNDSTEVGVGTTIKVKSISGLYIDLVNYPCILHYAAGKQLVRAASEKGLLQAKAGAMRKWLFGE